MQLWCLQVDTQLFILCSDLEQIEQEGNKCWNTCCSSVFVPPGASGLGGSVNPGQCLHFPWASCSVGQAPVPCLQRCWQGRAGSSTQSMLLSSPWHLVLSGAQGKGRVCWLLLWVLGELGALPCDSRFSLITHDLSRRNQRRHPKVQEGAKRSRERQLLMGSGHAVPHGFVCYFSFFCYLHGTGWLHRTFKCSYLGGTISSSWSFPVVEMLKTVASPGVRETFPTPTISTNDTLFL